MYSNPIKKFSRVLIEGFAACSSKYFCMVCEKILEFQHILYDICQKKSNKFLSYKHIKAYFFEWLWAAATTSQENG